MAKPLLEAIQERPLLGDGAMGTQLMAEGLAAGTCGEQWNLTEPGKVLTIQRRYVEAGSDCILSNTFGGCRITLDGHGLADQAPAINRAAVGIAREAFGEKAGYVIGDIGPFGGFMAPYGDVEEDDVRDALNEQAKALVEAGVDAVIVETQTALEEFAIGIKAAKQAGAGCVIGSMAYDVGPDGTTLRTMMGVDPDTAVRFMLDQGVDIVGLNCGSGMDIHKALLAVKAYRRVTDLPIMVQPNAGQPELVDGKVVYGQDPASMAAGVPPLLDAGVNIIGSCCGSTPEHIRAFRQTIDAYPNAGV
jgi:5-methyltetrahydrofolate--homocysteine methyltransferase